MKHKKDKPMTFEKWLRTLPNGVIWCLANQLRRDVARTTAIQREFNRRLKIEGKTVMDKYANDSLTKRELLGFMYEACRKERA